jgi:hypothetical protein
VDGFCREDFSCVSLITRRLSRQEARGRKFWFCPTSLFLPQAETASTAGVIRYRSRQDRLLISKTQAQAHAAIPQSTIQGTHQRSGGRGDLEWRVSDLTFGSSKISAVRGIQRARSIGQLVAEKHPLPFWRRWSQGQCSPLSRALRAAAAVVQVAELATQGAPLGRPLSWRCQARRGFLFDSTGRRWGARAGT